MYLVMQMYKGFFIQKAKKKMISIKMKKFRVFVNSKSLAAREQSRGGAKHGAGCGGYCDSFFIYINGPPYKSKLYLLCEVSFICFFAVRLISVKVSITPAVIELFGAF